MDLIDGWASCNAYIRADLASMGVPGTVRTFLLDPVARFTRVSR